MTLVISEVFTVKCTDVWNNVCQISCLHYTSLSHEFDNHIQIHYIKNIGPYIAYQNILTP